MRMLVVVFVTVSFLSATAGAAPYDQLFELGRSWKYRSAEEVKYGDEPPQHASATAECRVASVKRLGGATVSTIECDEIYGGTVGIAGQWVRTSRGLWHAYVSGELESATELRRLIRTPPVIAARPRVVPRRASTKDEFAPERWVTRDGATWCAHDAAEEANGGHDSSVCFADGRIVSMESSGWSYGEGGSESSSTTELIP